jgi:hypothetical protein
MTNKLNQYDRVRYCGPFVSDENLAPGDVGTILEDYGDGYYEVQFDGPDGMTAKAIRAFPTGHLEKVYPPS